MEGYSIEQGVPANVQTETRIGPNIQTRPQSRWIFVSPSYAYFRMGKGPPAKYLADKLSIKSGGGVPPTDKGDRCTMTPMDARHRHFKSMGRSNAKGAVEQVIGAAIVI